MEPYDVIVNQPVVIDNVSIIDLQCFFLFNAERVCWMCLSFYNY